MVHAIIHTITLNTSGTAGKCIEGREFIIALPESFVEYKADDVVRLFTDSFHKRYDVECSAALHHNKKMTNYHIHLVFNERKMLEHPEVKIATSGSHTTLYTNATLVTPKIMETLKKYPPHKIGITLYGSDPEIYETVCGNRAAFQLPKLFREA